MKRHLIKIIIIGLLAFSCNNRTIKETSDYKFEASKASIYHEDYTNKVSTNPLEINAIRINLSELLNTIFKNDSTFFQFKNKKLSDIKLKTSILLKNETILVKNEILELILDELNLNSIIEDKKLFELKVIDTTKLYRYSSGNTSNDGSKIYKSKDSISLNNVSLKQLSTLINERFNINSFSTNKVVLIDYSIKNNDFESFKKDLKNDLGIAFFDTKRKQITYIISEN